MNLGLNNFVDHVPTVPTVKSHLNMSLRVRLRMLKTRNTKDKEI